MRDFDFVGSDANSERDKCPAVWRDPLTGDFYQQGRIVTDPDILKKLGQDISLADDEAVVWQPANMADALTEAAAGSYRQGHHGPGTPTFRDLLARTDRSAVHLEMRDSYDPNTPAFREWLSGGSGVDDGWDEWCELIGSARNRGVQVRRARIISEPITDYIRWEHMVTAQNIRAGEDVRWLPRRQARDLLLPGADFWMFDQRLVRFNYNAGDGTPLDDDEFVTDPRIVRQAVAAFEMVWERAVPHEEYKVDHTPPTA